MAVSDKDLFAFLGLMPPDMKKRIVACVEAVYGDTIEKHKEQQIQKAEALVLDVQKNPGNYTSVTLGKIFSETIGKYEISDALERRIKITEAFISYRSISKWNTDGTTEEHRNATYMEFLDSDNYKFIIENLSSDDGKGSRKRRA